MSTSTVRAKTWHNWFKPFARLGYGARGLVYLVVAFLVAGAALTAGSGGDTKDAVRFISQSAFSVVLIPLLIISLAGYSVWRIVQAVFDTDDHGVKPTGLGVRAGLLASSATYGLLMLFTLSLWWGSFSDGGDSGGFAQTAAGFIGAGPVSLAVASVFVIVGGAHIWKAIKRKYRDHIEAREHIMRWVDVAAIGGLSARGIIFFIIALLFYRHGLSSGEGGQANLEDALAFIAGLPFGSLLLGATAAGLMLFSLYSFSEGIWRRINVENA